jgi:hypothetical protein
MALTRERQTSSGTGGPSGVGTPDPRGVDLVARACAKREPKRGTAPGLRLNRATETLNSFRGKWPSDILSEGLIRPAWQPAIASRSVISGTEQARGMEKIWQNC